MLRGRSDVKCYDKNKTLIQKTNKKGKPKTLVKGRQDTFGGDGSAEFLGYEKWYYRCMHMSKLNKLYTLNMCMFYI